MSDGAAEPAKRFYERVEVVTNGDVSTIALDGRQLRTPKRAELALPLPLASAVADEWEAQVDHILPLTMPLTRLVNTAIDGVAPVMDAVRGDIANFATNDLILYRADGPSGLLEKQANLWDPVVTLMASRFAVSLTPTQGIMPVAQDPRLVDAVRGSLPSEPLPIAALHQLTTITGSAFLALAHASGDLTFEALIEAANVDEDWNIAEWGADEEAMARRAHRERDAAAASDVLRHVA